jgi:uncharacterized membrane protein
MSETSSTAAESTGDETTVGGLSPELAGVVIYLFAPLSSLVFFVLEEENEFVRFHAMQSLLLSVIAYVLISVTSFFLIGILLIPVYFLFILFMMYKSYNGEMWEIPGLGGFAKSYI